MVFLYDPSLSKVAPSFLSFNFFIRLLLSRSQQKLTAPTSGAIVLTIKRLWAAAIAQWNRQRLPCSNPEHNINTFFHLYSSSYIFVI